MLAAVRLRICPRFLVSNWAIHMMEARSWHEKGELGIDYVTAPAWIPEAFNILAAETDKAMTFKRENSK